MFSWLKRQIKKILPGLSDDILDLKPDGSLPEAGPSIIRDEKTEERDARTVVDSPSHPIFALKKALDDLVEKSDRISSTPGTAGQIPTEWFDLYDKAESAFREADLWVRGGEDGRYANAALKKHYKDSLWKAIAGLRTANRFREAVKLWSLARLSSDAFTEETVRLAEAVADHIKTDKDFSKTPETARNIALLGIEASVLIRFENGKQKKIECLFEGLRIDWATPKTHPQVVENIRTIKDLIDFGGLLSNPVIIDLGFWYAMGHWRTGLTSPAEQSALFEELIKLEPNNEVFRWCKLRTDYESDLDDGVRRLEDGLQYWPVTVHDDPQKLAAYFESLLAAECMSELRKEQGQISGSKRFTRKTLQDIPKMVLNGGGLDAHILKSFPN